MGTVRWVGGAVKLKQVTTITVSGTWATSDTATLTINGKDLTVTVGTDTSTTNIATLLKEAWNGDTQTGTGDHTSSPPFADGCGSAIPEFRRITATSSGAVLTLTADYADEPFTVTASESTAGGGALGTPTTTTSATGPNDFNNADNWDTGVVPVDADDIRFDNGSVDCLNNLSQSAITPASITITSNYTGSIGRPETNTDESSYPYPEYRDTYLTLGTASDAQTITITIGGGSGSGSGRIKLNTGSAQTVLNVRGTGQTLESGVPALLWKGTHASNEANILKGDVGIAYHGGETATVANLRVAYIDNVEGDSTVQCGSGTTLTTIVQMGGTLDTNSAVTTATINDGEYIHNASTLTTLNADGGTVKYNSNGTLTTANVGSDATLDFRNDTRAVTVTNCNLYENSAYYDPQGRVTVTNGWGFPRTGTSKLRAFITAENKTLTESSI